MFNILVCDDEKDIVSALKIYLESEGYTVFTAYNGKEALELAEDNEFHLVIIDIMMPIMDGISAMAKLRHASNVPVILLTAKGEDTDKVLGLNVGADDYVTKPFNPVELMARVRSQLRRFTQLGGSNTAKDRLCIGNVCVDDNSKQVYVDDNEISLTPTEYEILKLLMLKCGKVLSPKEIYKEVWNDAPLGAENTVAVHIRHIREKIEINPADPRYLKVVWGHGYKFDEVK